MYNYFYHRLLFVVLLLIACVWISQCQRSDVLVAKREFTSENEVITAYPELKKDKLVIGHEAIQIVSKGGTVIKIIERKTIPLSLNSFILSPDREYFVAFEEVENETKDLFFYRSDGTLLSRQPIDVYPTVKFSNNGEHVVVFDMFGRGIFVFSKTGLLLFSGDYVQMVGGESKALHNILLSEDGEEILINADNDIHLINIKDKHQLFSVSVGWVLGGSFYSSTEKLVIMIQSDEGANELKVLSKKDGTVLEEITNVEDAMYLPKSVLVSRNSNIVEYELK